MVAYALENLPGAIEMCAQVIATAQNGRDIYEQAHWGVRAKGPGRLVSVPDSSTGIIVMGHLHAIAYDTAKGADGQGTYEHRFRSPSPLLAFCADGSGLVLVRDRSRYTVGPEGIVG